MEIRRLAVREVIENELVYLHGGLLPSFGRREEFQDGIIQFNFRDAGDVCFSAGLQHDRRFTGGVRRRNRQVQTNDFYLPDVAVDQTNQLVRIIRSRAVKSGDCPRLSAREGEHRPLCNQAETRFPGIDRTRPGLGGALRECGSGIPRERPFLHGPDSRSPKDNQYDGERTADPPSASVRDNDSATCITRSNFCAVARKRAGEATRTHASTAAGSATRLSTCRLEHEIGCTGVIGTKPTPKTWPESAKTLLGVVSDGRHGVSHG